MAAELGSLAQAWIPEGSRPPAGLLWPGSQGSPLRSEHRLLFGPPGAGVWPDRVCSSQVTRAWNGLGTRWVPLTVCKAGHAGGRRALRVLRGARGECRQGAFPLGGQGEVTPRVGSVPQEGWESEGSGVVGRSRGRNPNILANAGHREARGAEGPRWGRGRWGVVRVLGWEALGNCVLKGGKKLPDFSRG